MQLTSIRVYPVKAAAGIEVEKWEVDSFGLRHDRRFMLVDPDGVFVTQREEPRLALLRPQLERDALRLAVPGAGERVVALEPGHGDELRVRVWSAELRALAPDPGVDRWLSEFCGRALRLVYLPETSFRRVDARYVPERRRTSFTDGFPFLVIGQASLDALNQRLARPLPMDRFRPNLVVGGSEPFAEDAWERIRIGELSFDLVKPCSRCSVTTTDQTLGVRDGDEPLRTLAQFRRRDGAVIFGQNAVHAGTGTLRTGTPVLVENSLG